MKLIPIQPHENKSDPKFASPSCQELLEMYESFYPKIGYQEPWVGYFILRDATIVGSCGFVGQPQEGKVEIAYWTFSEYEGQGIASQACQELIKIAISHNPQIRIYTKTAPQKNASTRILEKNQFSFQEIVIDDEIGEDWLWVYSPNLP